MSDGCLRPELAARVAVVARLAAERGVEAFLVGGTVRDLLLGRDSPDLDFVVVGDGSGLAAAVHRELGGRLIQHAEFLTADVIDAAGIHLDIATARRESYDSVAALPAVQPTHTLDDDLRRRDFTVNAMALRLTAASGADGSGGGGAADRKAEANSVAYRDASTDGANDADGDGGGEHRGSGEVRLELDPWLAAGQLADPLGGRRDLAAGALRVLHERSFFDDPTRILRGVRFEVRLGARLTPETEALARQAVAAGAFSRLSGSRLWHELGLLLDAEPGPAAALAGLDRLHDLGVLGALHPRLGEGAVWPDARRRLFDAAGELAWYHSAGRSAENRESPMRPRQLFLLALAASLSAAERGELGARLLLAGDELRLLTGFVLRLAAAALRFTAGARPHEVDGALCGLAGEELLLLASQAGAVARSWVRRYWTELRPLALQVRGADLVAAGVPPGPAIGDALRATRAARLDGEIGPAEELAFALAALHDPSSAARGIETR